MGGAWFEGVEALGGGGARLVVAAVGRAVAAGQRDSVKRMRR